MGDTITSKTIDLNEPMPLSDLLDLAGVPEWLGANEVTIGYGGCGSHGVELSWFERFQAMHPSVVKAGWRVEYPDFAGALTKDAEVIDGEVLLTIGDRQIVLGLMTATGGQSGGTPFVHAAPPRPTDA